MWCALRPTKTTVVEPQNKFAADRAPIVPDNSEVHVPVKHYFSETFGREKFVETTFAKGEFNNFVTH